MSVTNVTKLDFQPSHSISFEFIPNTIVVHLMYEIFYRERENLYRIIENII